MSEFDLIKHCLEKRNQLSFNQIQWLMDELERLKEGKLTDEEFQNICHNFDEKDECKFKQGCLDTWKKLFGEQHGKELVAPYGYQFVAAKIPDGWELADRVMRPSKLGEYCIAPNPTNGDWQVIKFEDEICYGPRVIVKKKWTWPDFLTANWIAYSPMGNWWAYMKEPNKLDCGWNSKDGVATPLSSGTLKIDLPVCSDWTKSLMKNPNYKGEE